MSNKTRRKKHIAAAIALAGTLVLTGCGSDPKTRTGGIGGGLNSGCIPITAQIPFRGTGIQFDFANIVGGRIPIVPGAYSQYAGQTKGQMAVGGAPVGGPYQRSGVDGTISMAINQSGQAGQPAGAFPPTNGYPTGTYGAASVTGFVQISSMTQNDIRNQVQMGNIPIGTGTNYNPSTPGTFPQPGAPGTYAGNICVSGIAVDLGHHYNTIYGGHVYLYLNNTTHGYALYF